MKNKFVLHLYLSTFVQMMNTSSILLGLKRNTSNYKITLIQLLQVHV